MTRMRPALLLTLVAVAGCGGKDDPPPVAVGASPRDTLRTVQEAMREAESFHVDGTQTDEDGTARLKADVAADGAVRLSLDQKGASVEMIVLGEDSLFVRGDQAFWEQTGAPAGALELLTGRWTKAPADDDARELADEMQPDVLADCLSERIGTLTSRKDTLDGEPVTVLADEGDRPGTAPGELWISAENLPLRLTQTGARRPGGPTPDPQCGDPDDEVPEDRSDLRLSRWDEPVTIEAPEDALDLEEIAGDRERPILTRGPSWPRSQDATGVPASSAR